MKEDRAARPIPGLSREEEERQLARIIAVAQENLTRTGGYIRQLSEEVHDLMETYGPKDKEGLALLYNTQSQLRENRRDLVRCEKARKKPYFGRIDFRDPKLPYEESYYVGRVGITGENAEPVVIDWRAPVASVYYENTMGRCRYVVKHEGVCEIDLKRKRTYEIAEDKLKDFFDSDVVANDELLTKYLAKSKKAVLGEIIATIQAEQNAIIRKSPKTNLIVQGVAGSGKTTVAMHRISYILYNYEEDFRPEDFYIIGSNRILLNYITSVLPDLDVYGVTQMTMEQLFVRLLYEDWDPQRHRICSVDRRDASACIKGSYEWFHDLERFCDRYEDTVIPGKEVRLEKSGVQLLSEEAIRSYRRQHPQLSVQGRINGLNELLLSKLENELTGKYVSYTTQEKRELVRDCRCHFGKDAWKGSIFALYQEFLQAQADAGKAVPHQEQAFDVYDLAALAYLYKRIKETDGIREASHVIIDEAQDFGMMAYGVLTYCLRDCTYTIMGDVSQNIHYGYGLNDWKDLQELILTGTYDSFELLKKSYRNTVEISGFATEILRHGSFPVYPVEPIIRHGREVRLTACRDEAGMLEEAAETIALWQKEGHETIVVICRDEAEASAVAEQLGRRIPLVKGDLETAEFGSGVMVLPVEFTKGLEFDAVLLYHPSAENYPAEDAFVKLLYVAATRALHELTVLHLGDLTDLIGKPVSEEKRMQSLESQVRKESREFGRREVTAREQRELDARQGDKERALRGYIGPRPIAVQQKTTGGGRPGLPGQRQVTGGAAGEETRAGMASRPHAGLPGQERITGSSAVGATLRQKKTGKSVGRSSGSLTETPIPLNTSPYSFRDVPDTAALRPRGHSRIDNSVRMVRRTKGSVELISSYGILRLTPLEDTVIRVQFQRDRLAKFEPGYWNYKPEHPVSWTAKEGKNLVELATGKLAVRIDKKTGALSFFDREGKRLLSEKAALPRQLETAPAPMTWVYFDWQKKEKLFAKGLLADDLERMNQKARYISFGGRGLRMPLLVSDCGYGIAVAARRTVMCCDIPMYGQYLYTDGEGQIDYYFLYGGAYPSILELYKKL